MASEIATESKDQVPKNPYGAVRFNVVGTSSFNNLNTSGSRISLPTEEDDGRAKVKGPISSSSYTLASDQSVYSSQVDNWMCSMHRTENCGVQLSRIPVAQRSSLVGSSSVHGSGFWYLMAMVLPLFSVNNCALWRCTPGGVLNAADLFLNNLRNYCGEVTRHMRRLAEDQMTRDLFATLMDIVIVIYAIGFLILSLYQASVFG